MSVQGRRLGTGLTCVLLLAGCITVPERTPDAVLLPTDFSATGTVPLPGRWWENFGDATLDRLVEQSLANNFSLQSVWARLDQAAAVERIARAELFPSLDAEGSAGRIARAQDLTASQIDLIDDRIEILEDRLDRREALLIRQYAALETAMASMQTQSSWLSQQIASLNGGGE